MDQSKWNCGVGIKIPTLNPVDFTNLGYLKSQVYLVTLMGLEHLKQ
jgi:hypothetical protein